jgi:hypothetical protein
MFLLRLTDSYIKIIPIIVAVFYLGCTDSIYPFQPIATKHIEFQTENIINNGQDLAIDIIYITYVQELREVSRLGPKLWFDAEQRSQWKFKESAVLKGGDHVLVKLDPLILKRTVLLVIFANYVNQKDPGKEQVIVDYAGQEKEVIQVKKSNLEPENKSLRYVK